MTEFRQTQSWLETILTTIIGHYQQITVQVKAYTKETVEHLILFCLCYILACIFLYLSIVHWRVLKFQNGIRSKMHRILLVIAHPDDECMFFGPSVITFAKQRNVKTYLLCLSSGKNYDMGIIRKRELYESCKVLGIDNSKITICNHTLMPDKIDVKWPIDLVAKLILNQIETYEIDTLITFDKHGISNHLNHCSIYYAIAHLSIEKKLPKDCTVFVLETVNILRKYWLLLDIPLSYLLSRTRFLVNFTDRLVIHKAMKQHRSQLVWFRRLYMLLSRYMLINTLQKMELSDIELDLEIDD